MNFAGEDANDTGGPSREFWRLFVREVCEEYFAGVDGKLTLLRNIPALEVSKIDLYENNVYNPVTAEWRY